MRVVKVRRPFSDDLAMSAHKADDINLLFEDPECREGHLSQIDGVLDDDSPTFGLQQRCVVRSNPELARLRRLLVEVDCLELEMSVLAGRDD
jgi:hypothetical protein